jgi:hypothetical protein
MKRQPNMCHKPKEELSIYALLPARASLIRTKSMTPTPTTTTVAATAAATEGCRAHHIFGEEDEKIEYAKRLAALRASYAYCHS